MYREEVNPFADLSSGRIHRPEPAAFVPVAGSPLVFILAALPSEQTVRIQPGQYAGRNGRGLRRVLRQNNPVGQAVRVERRET